MGISIMGRVKNSGGYKINFTSTPVSAPPVSAPPVVSAPPQYYWINVINGGGAENFKGVNIDSNRNTIIFGDTASTGGLGQTDFILMKFDTEGSALSQQSFGSTRGDVALDMDIDQNNILYCCGDSYLATGTRIKGIISKVSGNSILWSKNISNSLDVSITGIKEYDGDVYVTGYDGSTTPRKAFIAKLNSSGVVQWKTIYSLVSVNLFAESIDIKDNILIMCGSASISGSYSGFIIKINTTNGNIIWQKYYSYLSNQVYFSKVEIDSNNNIIVCGLNNNNSNNDEGMFVAKFDADGVFKWAKSTSGSGNIERFSNITLDSQNNIYTIGNSDSSSGINSDDIMIMKFNTSGTTLWQKMLGGVGSDLGFGIAIDDNNGVIICGNTTTSGNSNASTWNGFVARLDVSGLLTGTWNGWTLQNRSLPETSITLIENTLTTTSAASTATFADQSFSFTNRSLPINKFNIT